MSAYIPEMSHFASNGDGLVVTVDSESGDVLWIQNYGSPVVAFYIWQREGLWKVMHTNVGIETLRYLTFMSGEVGRITKWKYPFPKETEAKSKLMWVCLFQWCSLQVKAVFTSGQLPPLAGREHTFNCVFPFPARNLYVYLFFFKLYIVFLQSICLGTNNHLADNSNDLRMLSRLFVIIVKRLICKAPDAKCKLLNGCCTQSSYFYSRYNFYYGNISFQF